MFEGGLRPCSQNPTGRAGQGLPTELGVGWDQLQRPECVHSSQIINWLGYRSLSRPVYTRPKCSVSDLGILFRLC